MSPKARYPLLILLAALAVTSADAVWAQFTVLKTSGTGIVLEVKDFALFVGRGGTAETRSDTDLVVYDPFHAELTERSLHFNGSLSDLRLGSGSAVSPGDDGDLLLGDGTGRSSIWLNGSAADMTLGTTGGAGDLFVRDDFNINVASVDGASGDFTNALGGNGLVKAWARVRASGVISSCFRCNLLSSSTQRLSEGTYEVDFTPLSTNIRSRPRSATLDTLDTGIAEGEIVLANRSGDSSSVFVRTTSSGGGNSDRAFILLIY